MGHKSSLFRSVHKTCLTFLVALALIAVPRLSGAQDNPFDASAEKKDEKSAPAAEAAPQDARAETTPAATPEATEEAGPATPPGKKSLDEYRSMLRRLSAEQKYEEMTKLVDEIEAIYPGDDSVAFYRTRAEKGLDLEATRERRKRATGTGATKTPDPSAPAPAESAPAPVEAAETPAPVKTKAPTPVPPPPAPAPTVQTSSGSGLMSKLIPIVIGVGLTGGGVMLILGLLGMKKKKPARNLPPMREDFQGDQMQQGFDQGFASPQQFPSSPSAPPRPAQAWDADLMMDAPGAGSPVDDDLFSPSSGSSRADAGIGSDIFNDPPTAKPTKPGSRSEDTAEQSQRFDFFQEEVKPSAVVAKGTPQTDDPIRFDMDSALGGFDTPSSKPAAKTSTTPWSGSDNLDSFPMLKVDSEPAPPKPAPAKAEPAAASAGTASKAPWESRSATATDKGKSEVFTLPSDDSLPAMSDIGQTASSARTETRTASKPAAEPDFPSFGEKSGAPSFAEMNLNAIKSPEFSETVYGMDLSKAADTNPGFDVQASDPKASTASSDLDMPQMPAGFGESTVILSKRELSDDPDLFLQSTQFGIPKSKPAAPQAVPERFKEFKADETIGINFGGETTAPPKTEKPSDPSKPKDNFERERDLGLQAFKDAEWDKAVYHLSIAAALRPEATDIKEQLRRARRMRKEKESGGAG